MTFQYIIVGIIVAASLFRVIHNLIRFFKTPFSGCEGCSGSCPVKAIKQAGK